VLKPEVYMWRLPGRLTFGQCVACPVDVERSFWSSPSATSRIAMVDMPAAGDQAAKAPLPRRSRISVKPPRIVRLGERDRLLVLPKNLSARDVEESFGLSADDLLELKGGFRGNARIGAAYQLVVLRATGRSPDAMTGIPKALLAVAQRINMTCQDAYGGPQMALTA
jgi:hypothetical protein